MLKEEIAVAISDWKKNTYNEKEEVPKRIHSLKQKGYKEEDLNSTCYGGSLCRDCMCIFLMENETSKRYSE